MEYKIQPWPHQAQAIELARARRHFALFFEMGCGKTLTAINIMRWKFQAQREILPTLILCPLIVVENWRREIEANTGQKVQSAVQCLTGTRKKREKQFALANKQIFVTNLDTINTEFWKEICRRQWSMLIVDESHKFKSPTAERTKKLIKFADRVQEKIIMTGSPILNSAMDVWAQIRLLSPSIFDENFYVFRNRYFYDHNAGMPTNKYYPDWRPRPNAHEELRQIVAAHSMRVTKAEVLTSLPPLVRQSVFVELTAEQMRLYREMEESFITYLNGEACVAEVALTRLLRLQQLIVGIVRVESGEVRRIATPKTTALAELVSDLCPQNKVIVWTNFVDTYQDVARVFEEQGLRYTMLRGGQGQNERQEAIDAFNRERGVSGIIANQQAGGVGIGLQAASYSLYYSKTFNLEHDQQSEARNHRGGSEIHEHVTRIDIVAQNTVDDDVTTALRNKTELSTFMLALRRRYGIEDSRGNGLGTEERGD